MKSGSRPRRPASCKSFKMPNFQVVPYAFSRSKNKRIKNNNNYLKNNSDNFPSYPQMMSTGEEGNGGL